MGEDFKCKVHCPNITLYSARMATDLEEATRGISLDLVDQEGLPVYIEATEIRGDIEDMPPIYGSS